MAQPTPYERQFAFSGQPRATWAEGLENELNAVKVTSDETLANLELIQRDDGALRNGIVTRDSLAPDLALAGLVALDFADEATAVAGEADNVAMAPLGVKQQIDARVASEPEAEAGSNNTKTMTPLRVKQQLTFATPHIAKGWFGVAGDNVADDSDALQALFDDRRSIEFPANVTFRTTKPLFVRQGGATLEGPPSAIIKMDPLGTGDGANYWISSALVVAASAYEAVIKGFTVDHNAQQWPLGSSIRRPGFFGVGGGDMYGVAVMAMAPKQIIDGLRVLNSFDNGIGVGLFDESDGQQYQGAGGTRVINTLTYACGSGKHDWSPFPGGYYHQGAGVGVMTGADVTVDNCYDIGSYNAFWADINGGARALFSNCVSYFCAGNLIASDAAVGSNQPWNTGGFGQSISYAGSGWDKTPGGLAFYSGSYGVNFQNCLAYQPAMYGFVCDYMSSNNILQGVRVVNAGRSALVFAGSGHKCISPVIEGAGIRIGEVAASGSVCGDTPAILVTGMQDIALSMNVDADVEIIAPRITHGQRYPTVSAPTPKYTHAIHARTRQGRPARVYVEGGSIEAGVTAKFLADSGSHLVEATKNDSGPVITAVNDSAAVSLQSGVNNALVTFQQADGAAGVVNYGGDLSLARNGGAGILMWANTVRLNGIPTSSAGLYPGDLWNDSGTLKIVP